MPARFVGVCVFVPLLFGGRNFDDLFASSGNCHKRARRAPGLMEPNMERKRSRRSSFVRLLGRLILQMLHSALAWC